MEGALLLTESAKSFIQSVFPFKFVYLASSVAISTLVAGELFKTLIHDKIFRTPRGRIGRNGTANKPSSRNQRLYCIRLDRLCFNSRLIIKSIPMIPLINTLQIAKRTIKSAKLIASFLLPFGKEGAQIINLCFRELIIFYICRQHGSDISVIVPFQKSITFLADVLFFVYNWCIDKYAALLFVSQGTLIYQAFN